MSGRSGPRHSLVNAGLCRVVMQLQEFKKHRVELAWHAEAPEGKHFAVVVVELGTVDGRRVVPGLGGFFATLADADVVFQQQCRAGAA